MTIEEAAADGHGCVGNEDDKDAALEKVNGEEGGMKEAEFDKSMPMEGTPEKKAHVRPVSEKLLGLGRPKPMYDDDEGQLRLYFFPAYPRSAGDAEQYTQCYASAAIAIAIALTSGGFRVVGQRIGH